ncbi:MAG: hypothetical protein ACI8UO_002766 [Verrucomicrobiales bacterium]
MPRAVVTVPATPTNPVSTTSVPGSIPTSIRPSDPITILLLDPILSSQASGFIGSIGSQRFFTPGLDAHLRSIIIKGQPFRHQHSGVEPQVGWLEDRWAGVVHPLAGAAMFPIEAEQIEPRWTFWTQGGFESQDQDVIGFHPGFSSDSHLGSVGVDRKLNEQLLIGFAVTGGRKNVEGGGNLGSADVDGVIVDAYALWQRDSLWSSLRAGVGWLDIDYRRNAFPGFAAVGSTEASQTVVEWKAGQNRELKLGETSFVHGPLLGMKYFSGRQDGFSERNAGIFNLEYGDHAHASLISELGWSLGAPLDTEWFDGWIQLRAGWSHEHIRNESNIEFDFETSPFVSLVDGQIVGRGPDVSGKAHIPTPQDDYLQLGVSLVAYDFGKRDHWTLSVDYEAQIFRSDFHEHYVSLQLSRAIGGRCRFPRFDQNQQLLLAGIKISTIFIISMTPTEIAKLFKVEGWLVTVEVLGGGNVNDTYRAIFRTTFDEKQIILQRINQAVFPDPEMVMANITAITNHAHKKIEDEAGDADRIWQLPRVIEAIDGRDYVQQNGEFWRGLSLIASAKSYERVNSIEHAVEAGEVLGHFQRLIADFPVSLLEDTLPGFHITPRYLANYDRVLATDEGRKRAESSSETKRITKLIEERRDFASVLEDALERGELQLRPIHGDPKISNIMIDDFSEKGTAIIDLDTVKPGLVHYDFGDAVRSVCNPAGEETTDLDEVCLDLDLLGGLVRGYLKEANPFLTAADRKYLFDSIRLITFELGLRFYTDFLAGNVYFKANHDLHNLDRARVQMKVCESVEERESRIRRALDEEV